MIICILKFLVETFRPPFWCGKTPTCDVLLFTALNWSFPSCVKPLFQGETKCEITDMKMQWNLYITVTLGKWQCEDYIQVNFAENMGRLIFGNLSGDRNISGDRYIQGRCLTVFSLTVFYKQIKLILTTKVLHLASFWKEEFLKLGDCLFPSFCYGFVGSYVGAGDRPYHRLCKIFSFSFIALGFRGELCPKASHYFWNFDIFS